MVATVPGSLALRIICTPVPVALLTAHRLANRMLLESRLSVGGEDCWYACGEILVWTYHLTAAF